MTYTCGMRVKSSTELRRTLSATLDEVVDDHVPVIVTRDGGRPAAVLVSLDDYASFEATAYLLKSPVNARRIADALAEFESGGGTPRSLVE